MKIVNRKQFLALPEGVIYAKFQPCVFGDIAVKYDSIDNDWYYRDLLEVDAEDSGEWADMLLEGMEKDISLPLDFECVSRDGFYDDDQLFTVFEKQDVISLIESLQKIVPDYPEIKKGKD